MRPSQLRLGELFSGAGGLSLGALQAEWKGKGYAHHWAVDRDADACRTYLKSVPGADGRTVLCEDVRTVDLAALPKIDVLAFGFPCNDFSTLGYRKGLDGPHGRLYEEGVRALAAHRPLAFVAENVRGLAFDAGGATLRRILCEFAAAGPGYRVTPHLYRAEGYGVPQLRRRIVIVGIRKDLGKSFRVPAPDAGPPRTAREGLENPPVPEGAANREPWRISPVVLERLSFVPPGGNARKAELPERLARGLDRAGFSNCYRRLHPDRPAFTVTASTGGGAHTYHWSEPRALTNRERARLQTFPDAFAFEGSRSSVARQIGMAVPPELARRVFRALLMTLHGGEYPSVEANIPVP